MSGADFHYRPIAGYDAPLVDRLAQYPREPDLFLDSARGIGRIVTAFLVRLFFRIEVVGSVPDVPRLALMPNHQSHLDTLAILAVLPERQRRRITVLAARDYFFRRSSARRSPSTGSTTPSCGAGPRSSAASRRAGFSPSHRAAGR